MRSGSTARTWTNGRKTAEAAKIEQRYRAAWAKAEEPTTTSCKCIPSIQGFP